LIDNTIPFNYAESPGAHDGAYWSRAIGPAVALQYTIIKQNLAKNPPPRAPESATPAPAAVEKPKDGPK
jgi:hypothetical protein